MNPHTSGSESIAWARRLKMRHLEGFLILKNSQSLSDAANRMHMTQSAMSHWLRELEELAGVKLVVRGRGMHLTPQGEALRRLATRVLGDVARTGEEFSALAGGAAASISIGSLLAGIAYLVPKAICEFQNARPDVIVRMVEGTFDQFLARLESRDLDLVVGSIDARAYGPHLKHEVFFEDAMIAVVGLHHPLANKQDVRWSDLTAYPWIMPSKNTLMRSRLDAILLEHGGAGIQPRLETWSVITIETVLRQSECVAVCSGSLTAHLDEMGLLRALPLSEKFGPIGAVYRDNEEHSEEMKEFLGILRRLSVSDGPVAGT